MMTTDHPQYRARQLFKLMRATPAGLHSGQSKVPNFYCQILVEEDIWGGGAVKETLFLPTSTDQKADVTQL